MFPPSPQLKKGGRRRVLGVLTMTQLVDGVTEHSRLMPVEDRSEGCSVAVQGVCPLGHLIAAHI